MKIIMKKKAFSLVEVLIVLCIIGVLVALLLPAIQAARNAQTNTQVEAEESPRMVKIIEEDRLYRLYEITTEDNKHYVFHSLYGEGITLNWSEKTKIEKE